MTAHELRQLFAPLDDLLVCGGDPRLALDPLSRLNGYGCGPAPSPETWNFASSTASTISERAYRRASLARERLMRSASEIGLDQAFDQRIEDMREELKACLQLPPHVGVIFAASGTDAQLQALFLARAFLGPALTTIIVGADQTGSGTLSTARGRHFGSVTARGRTVAKDAPIVGLACEGVALPLVDAASEIRARADADAAVLGAIEAAVAAGSAVLLQTMDCSKLGWRAPGDACIEEIARRWPRKVRIAVDACQMRLSRAQIRSYLDRGCMVLITGSKFFGGPAFSGALLVPGGPSDWLATGEEIAPGLHDYTSRSDWPKPWAALRSRLPAKPNFGQWLRWEAALEDIKAYYRVPAEFRTFALRQFALGIESLIMLSPSLQLIEPCTDPTDGDGEEFACPTIFPVTMRRHGDALARDDCQAIYRALGRDVAEAVGGSESDRQLAGRRCLVGQPVRIDRRDGQPAAVLRLCIGARQVIETWSPDPEDAQDKLQNELDRIAEVVAKLELLLDHAGKSTEVSHGL